MRYELCYKVQVFIRWFEHKFCFTKKEICDVESSVKRTYEKSSKYDNIEMQLPQLLEAIQKLENEKEYYKHEANVASFEVDFFKTHIVKLYYADLENNFLLKQEIFNKLGFSLDKIQEE